MAGFKGTFEACGIGDTILEGTGSVSLLRVAVLFNADVCSMLMVFIGISKRPLIKGGHVPPPSTFAPTHVDVDSWIKALASFGAARAVLVVSHGCGFNTFPSRTKFPEFQFEYNYTVANSGWTTGSGDVAKVRTDHYY